MKPFDFKCPSCERKHIIQIYSGGMSDADSMRCTNCDATVIFDLYDVALGGKKKLVCECGGKLSRIAPLRCPKCNNIVDISAIKKQINWWGSKEGSPGVIMGKQLDQKKYLDY
ncbi:MAG: hypothetical protein BMS9Abin26_0426 [Gammaproteobacteria bacterium]|nr:MAG: hypothetical protein BMS9Abin26_0426 [Gammaproteobacteria bacterium]